MQKGLIALAIGAFTIGMTEFVMMGILPDLASSLKVSIPQAGHFISAYALGVVVGAPLLTILLQNKPPKTALIALAVWITVFNSLSALANDYTSLLVLRFLSGLPHGTFFGIGAVVAGKLAKEGKTAQAIAIMFSGLTIANVIGVPLGTYIGHYINWRITFCIVGVIGLLTILSVMYWMPEFEATEKSSFKKDLAIFKRLDLWLVLLIAIIGTGGFFSWYSYIAPLFTEVSKFDAGTVTYLMVIAGLGMTFGNFLGGKLSDTYSPLFASIGLLVGMCLVLMLLTFVADNKITVTIMTFVIGAVAFAIVAPVQIMMMQSAKGAEILGSSISPAAMNAGNALGAYLAGIPLTMGYDYTSPDWVGFGLAFVGILIAIALFYHRKQKENTLIACKA
ncbi:MFS transporter [Flavobacterium inviolabile]|uniref:MFS transporter n=1 Tax=Flavobacterium inviolabile TaxID=2748320 RepID=UPI0015AC5C42|nr:MFS transporter [Flavobacterium inviolabile]